MNNNNLEEVMLNLNKAIKELDVERKVLLSNKNNLSSERLRLIYTQRLEALNKASIYINKAYMIIIEMDDETQFVQDK